MAGAIHARGQPPERHLSASLRQAPAGRKSKADCVRNFSRAMTARCGRRARWETASGSALASPWRSSSAW